MTKRILTGLFITLFAVNTIQSQNTPKDIIETFFNSYEKNGSSKAIDDLYATNPWTSRIQDGINNIKNQIERYDIELVGEYYGYEELVTKKIGDSFVLKSYFVKYDRQLLRFTFQFYKPKDKWRLYSFAYDDNYDDEVKEAAKMYYLDLDSK